MAYQNTTVHTGDSVIIPVSTKTCAGVDVDLSGLTVSYYIRPHQPEHATAIVTKTVQAEDGLVEILLNPSDTNRNGAYFHELKATDGAAVQTGFTGNIQFTYKEISRARCSLLEAIFDMEVFGEVIGLFDFSVAGNSMYAPIFDGGL